MVEELNLDIRSTSAVAEAIDGMEIQVKHKELFSYQSKDKSFKADIEAFIINEVSSRLAGIKLPSSIKQHEDGLNPN